MNAVLKTPRVRILDDTVVNQIAAGEVVERPASVVKELVENSLDAGAREISVSVTNGGRSSIEVLDNGWGMSREDALFAVERFGTSKIQSVSDLEKISSHGFRGEAVPSIASVSRFTLETALHGASPGTGAQLGTEIVIEGGRLKDVREKNLPPGTRVTVRHLFFNVPARKKFLRSEATEEGLIRNLLIDFAAGYPEVFIRFSSDGVEKSVYPPGLDFFARAASLKVAGERPVRIDFKQTTAAGPIEVQGLLCQPIETVSQANRLRLLINRRSVRDKLLLKAIRDGYGAYLRPGRYPMGVLSVLLPPEDVDVNVHPQKTEVRFRRPDVVFQAIVSAVKRGLGGTVATSAPPESPFRNEFFGKVARPASAEVSVVFGAQVTEPQATVLPLLLQEQGREERETKMPAEAAPHLLLRAPDTTPSLSHMRYVGQFFACYLLFEGGERIAIMDMHAAHERVMFFRLKQQFLGGAIHTQQLLIPEVVDCGPAACEVIERSASGLWRLGFELDRISDTHLAIRMMPAALSSTSARSLFQDLLSEPDFSDWLTLLEEKIDAVLARMACHRSIRSGRLLEDEEAYALVRELGDAETSGLCPHGRPTVKYLARHDLEAMFGRVLA